MRNIVPINSRTRQTAITMAGDPLDITGDGRPKGATEYTGLREYLAMAKRRWLLITFVTLLSVLYTLNSMRVEKPQYRSRATVRLVDASRAIAGDMVGSAGSSDMPFSATADPIQSQIQILQSEAVATLAVERNGLRLVPAESQSFPAEITEVKVSDATPAKILSVTFRPADFAIATESQTAAAAYGSTAEADGISVKVGRRPQVASTRFDVIPREGAINDILGRFKVTGRPRTDILDLSYTGNEANQAQRIANAMAESYQIYNTQNAQQFARRRRAFLESQLRATDSALVDAMAAYSSYKAGRQGTLSAAVEQTTAASQIDTKRLELSAEKRALESMLSRARASGGNAAANVRGLVASTAVTSNAAVQQLASQLLAQENMRDNLVDNGAAPTNPDVLRLNNQINATGRRMVEAVESQLESVNAQLNELSRQRPSGVGQAAAAITTGETREAQLAAEMQTHQRLSGDLKTELQQARMAEAVEAGQVEIVQLARYPGYRIATGTGRELLVAVLVGLMFGFGAAVLVDSLDKSIRKRGDIEPLLGVPGLVVIPRLSTAGPTRQGPFRALPRRASQRASRNDNQMLDLVTLSDPRSTSAEAFRTLRTNLMFSQAVQEMRTLVVTSASPGEGKTVTAANLAVAFAQQGMRVLLVDCDLRRGRLHRVFGMSREPGMSDFVLGYEDEEKVTRASTVPGLYVIPTGKLPPNPAEMLGGQHAADKFKALTEGYDLVIVDTPPLLAASDAAILATLADGVIMVLRAGATESAAAQQAMQQLQSLGARVVGAVLNDPESEVAKYGAYYEYNYSRGPA